MININNKKFIKILIFIGLLLLIILIGVGLLLFILIKNKPINNFHKVYFKNISFIEEDDNILEFIQPFKESCKIFLKQPSHLTLTTKPQITTFKEWQEVCNKFNKIDLNKKEDLILFLKNNFQPYLIKGKNQTHFTGYYRIELEGSLIKDDIFKYPIYKIPQDLVEVKVSNFNKDVKDITIYGKVENNKLIPYYTREEITNGKLDGKNLELVWLKDKYGAFLLHIQGSGVINIKDINKKIYLSYAGKNGHPFKGITNYMKQNGYLPSKKMGLEPFYEFFNQNPQKIDEVLNQNPSYIFFKVVNKNNWFAALGTNPYKERTVAVDPNYISLGVPLLINMAPKNKDIIRLVVANDTGSAIKGLGRVDFYWGLGKKAGEEAINTNTKGDLYILLPIKQK